MTTPTRKLWLHEMTWPEIEEVVARTSIVLLPMGSTEQHGPSLPEGTDTLVPVYLAEEIARRVDVPIAPPVPFSTAEQHMSFSGTISLRPTTLIALLRDIVASLLEHGFRDFVLLNGHILGARPALLAAADEIQIDYPEAKLWEVDLNAIALDDILAVTDSDVWPHAEEVEVSQMLVIRPELVHLDRAVDVPVPRKRLVLGQLGGAAQQRATRTEYRTLSPTGILGLAAHGTEEKGRVILDAQVRHICAFVEELRALRETM